MENRLRVCWWDGSLVGHLIHRSGLFFVYDESWLAGRGLNLSPLSLPFSDAAYDGARGGVEGLPGLIADCLPDAWGQKIARAEFAAQGWGAPAPLRLLAWRGLRGLGALQFLPVLGDEPSGSLEKISVAAMARGAREIERGEPSAVLPQLAKGGTAGGVRPKTLVLAYADGTLRVGPPDGRGRACLLKFDDRPDGADARCEHTYAQLARSAGLRMAETSLITEGRKSARRHLLVTRFDLPDGGATARRTHYHSLSGLLHKAAWEIEYGDLFRTAIRLRVPPEELGELARRMLFNVLMSNHDDHGKNHAFQLDETTGRWTLTPSFDLTYVEGYLSRGLAVGGEVWPRVRVMEELCAEAGVAPKDFREMTDQVRAVARAWPAQAAENGVPGDMIAHVARRLARIQEVVFA